MSTGKVNFWMLRSHGILTCTGAKKISLFGPNHTIRGHQIAIGCLFGVWGMKMHIKKSKICFLKVRVYVLNKNGPLYCYNWVTSRCLLWPLRNPSATQQTFNSYLRYLLLLNSFPTARLKEF